jgi:hypothetical protein
VRLGAFNGLHLWLRVRKEHPTVAGLIISAYADPVIEQEARRHGAAFLLKPLRRGVFLRTIETLLSTRTRERRRWRRTSLAIPLSADVDRSPASVLDVSRGGLRLRLQGDIALGQSFAVRLIDPPISLTMRHVWRSEAADGISCGASLAGAPGTSGLEAEQRALWDSLVDAMEDRGVI